MIAWEGWAPICKDALKPTICNIGCSCILDHKGEPKSVQGRLKGVSGRVERQLTVNSHIQWKAVLLELPCIKASVGWQAQIDAFVVDQISRHRWRRVLAEVGGRSHTGHAQLGADAHRHHILCQLFTQAHTGVEALGDDIGEAATPGLHTHESLGVQRGMIRMHSGDGWRSASRLCAPIIAASAPGLASRGQRTDVGEGELDDQRHFLTP
jgi:hypothetical protein